MSKRTGNGSTTHLQNSAASTKKKLMLSAKGADSIQKSDEGILTTSAKFIIEHQIELPMTLIGLIVALHGLRVPVASKFFYLSYETSPGSGEYGVGFDDVYYVAFWVLAFTATREAIMRHVFQPFARWNGVHSAKKLVRFAEQGWSFLYYVVFWTLGMYVMYQGPHWFNVSHYWIDYPHTPISKICKWYYLVQFAFWVQQVFVLNIEERRKDFTAMLTHHIITCVLMASSYFSNFTRIGNAVLCTMDFADIILPLAKILNYLNMRTICDIMFVVFLVSWLVTRHILFGIIIWSTFVGARARQILHTLYSIPVPGPVHNTGDRHHILVCHDLARGDKGHPWERRRRYEERFRRRLMFCVIASDMYRNSIQR
ncbi:TLC domain-containing protein [Jimgerdemannia flammicorona]|uniref:TLC domain-containing protein n=1 Tax=Jimgerdemannia flammicorona TaxID=994334 RepID=A0A433D399_9FUNG|nr:TLC domain-containing protein [Jimgerdemannia flammicorona]